MREANEIESKKIEYNKAQYFIDNVDIDLNGLSLNGVPLLFTAIDTYSYLGFKILVNNKASINIEHEGRSLIEYVDIEIEKAKNTGNSKNLINILSNIKDILINNIK